MAKKFNKYVDLDNAVGLLELYASRASLVNSVMTDETGNIDPQNCEDWRVRLCLARSIEFSEIIFDYLIMIKGEAEKLRVLVDELYAARKSEKEGST